MVDSLAVQPSAIGATEIAQRVDRPLTLNLCVLARHRRVFEANVAVLPTSHSQACAAKHALRSVARTDDPLNRKLGGSAVAPGVAARGGSRVPGPFHF